MVLHGVYDNGKIEILEKDIPKIKTYIKIYFENTRSNWKKPLKKVKLDSDILVSDLIIEDRSKIFFTTNY
ncbi:MAG: hypothetical protein KA885_10735 [Spirochaetes bacterium]|nr:hypothetical protein [Spirochaetota bacterium]